MTKPRRKPSGSPSITDSPVQSDINRSLPLVFVSHDTRDADLAEAFDNLLTDASGGVLKTFRSSDRKGQAGIEYGAEWFPTIMAKLNDATDVVALLTPHSIGRPWILYEAGVAKGKLNTTVFGVALGISLPKASIGPFAQFQNSADDQESLTKLVLQLIRRNPDAAPREAAVGRQVAAFLEAVEEMLKKRGTNPDATEPEIDATTVAKLFEEVKIMFRDLPDMVTRRIPNDLRRKRRMHPMRLADELLHMGHFEEVPPESRWLLFASMFRDQVPWFYELAMDVYRAYCSNDATNVSNAWERMNKTVMFASHSPLMYELKSHGDHETTSLLRHFPDFAEHLLRTIMPPPAPARRRTAKKTTRKRGT